MNRSHVRTALLASAAVLTLALTACSGGSPTPGKTSEGAGPAAPGDTMTVSVLSGYAPFGFDKAGKVAGIDPDLGKLLGDILKVDTKIQADAFSNSLLGLQSGRVQLVPATSITAERVQTMDMVPYFIDFYRLAVLPDAHDVGDSIESLCGLNIGLVNGDVGVPYLAKVSTEKCGGTPIRVSTYPDGGQVAVAVQAGRVDAWGCSYSACSYQNETNPGTWKITGPKFLENTIGIAAQKDSGWGPAVVVALKKAIADGSYQKVLDSYGLGDAAVTADQVVLNSNPQGN